MFDIKSQRIRLEQEKLELLSQKESLDIEDQKLKTRGRDLKEVGEYLEKSQWTNYLWQLEVQHKLNQQIWLDDSENLKARLKQIRHQIEIVEQIILRLLKNSLNIPKIIEYRLKWDEELLAYLVEYRIKWYEEKPFILLREIKWLIHLRVWIKTWLFVVIELGCKQLLVKTIHWFQPLEKPRLPR